MKNHGIVSEKVVEQVIGEEVLAMADRLQYAPDCIASTTVEIDGIVYKIAVKRIGKTGEQNEQ